MENEGIVLVVGSGVHRYREYLLAGAATANRLWLLNGTDLSWQHRHVAGHTVVKQADAARMIPDVEALIAAAESVAEEHRVVGVFSYDEALAVAAASIAETLGLPGLSIEGADRCRNKHRTRQVLTAAGLHQPRFAYAATLAQATGAATDFGYPVVVKPRGMGASIGVVRVDALEQMATAFDLAEQSSGRGEPCYEGGVLVEEMLTGPEISIDGTVCAGEYRPFFLAHKQLGPPPYFEEYGHVVVADDPLLVDAKLLGMLAAAHRALGLGYGITHTEVKLTPAGPAIVEVNARLGGDLIPYLGLRATGIDPGRIAVAVARGDRPDLTPLRHLAAGIRFSYPPRDGLVTRVDVPAACADRGIVEAAIIAPAGTVLRLPPRGYVSRYALVICEASGRAPCEAALDAASARTAVHLDPHWRDTWAHRRPLDLMGSVGMSTDHDGWR